MSNLLLSRWAGLYSNMTEAELALEPAIAAMGLCYRCQHPVWSVGAFADFALPMQRIIVEVDGPDHKRKKAKDAERTRKLEKAGWRVWRCTNHEALTDPQGTVNRLRKDMGL